MTTEQNRLERVCPRDEDSIKLHLALVEIALNGMEWNETFNRVDCMGMVQFQNIVIPKKN